MAKHAVDVYHYYCYSAGDQRRMLTSGQIQPLLPSCCQISPFRVLSPNILNGDPALRIDGFVCAIPTS